MVHFFTALRKAGHMILYIAPPFAGTERLRAAFRNRQFSGSVALAVQTPGGFLQDT
jgi:hypothetical protein